jgi:hypothetical protein
MKAFKAEKSMKAMMQANRIHAVSFGDNACAEKFLDNCCQSMTESGRRPGNAVRPDGLEASERPAEKPGLSARHTV